ncbi:MAG: ribosome maturation factor RimP [Actinobacteria bacterium]|nr:ribosome maturation factor RimP [Actinomycetota bacterium]
MTGTDDSVTDGVHRLVLPILADLGLELYDLEYVGGTVKVTVDTPAGSPGGVDVDQLARATRLISRDLDHVDPIPGRYTLEVSSPGLERNLRLPRHFRREIGKQVTVRLANVVNGERRTSGELIAASEIDFTLRLESGEERVIALDQVDRARTVFVWEAAPKPVPGARKGARGKSSASGPRSGAEKGSATADLCADIDTDPDDPDFDETDTHDDQEP